MATKKKVDNEAGETAKTVDKKAVAKADDDGTGAVDTQPVEQVSTPVDEVVGNPLSQAQGVLGVKMTGLQNHATKMALRKFQSQNGLRPTGRLDEHTTAALHI